MWDFFSQKKRSEEARRALGKIFLGPVNSAQASKKLKGCRRKLKNENKIECDGLKRLIYSGASDA